MKILFDNKGSSLPFFTRKRGMEHDTDYQEAMAMARRELWGGKYDA